jgi:hypothetical protein
MNAAVCDRLNRARLKEPRIMATPTAFTKALAARQIRATLHALPYVVDRVAAVRKAIADRDSATIDAVFEVQAFWSGLSEPALQSLMNEEATASARAATKGATT